MGSIVDLDSTILHNVFEGAQLFVAFCIALRAFYLYIKLRNPHLFILWLSLSTIVLTSIASLIGDNHLLFHSSINTNWFKYIGQIISWLFIWLSTFRIAQQHALSIKNWHIVSSLLLTTLLLATPFLPPFPNIWTQIILSTLRAVICMFIFFQYIILFVTKTQRFSLFMSVAFLLLAFGYFVIFPKFLYSHQDLLTNTGDIMRICGFIVLLITYLIG